MQTTREWSRRLWTALALVGALGLVAAPAYAEDEGEGDAKDKIQKQMEKIRQLMEENETALLDLSAGAKATPKGVDVKVPDPDGTEGESGSGDEAGSEARKKIDELLHKQKQSGEPIPDEITRLVKMIPL